MTTKRSTRLGSRGMYLDASEPLIVKGIDIDIDRSGRIRAMACLKVLLNMRKFFHNHKLQSFVPIAPNQFWAYDFCLMAVLSGRR